MRVLIVDDAPESRDTLRRALALDEHIEVVGEAGSGAEALTQAERLRPDIVLMDVRMPEGDGIEATRLLSVRVPEARVVALTAHEDAATVRDMLTAGATGYVVKGASIDELLSAVRGAAAGGGTLDERILPVAIEELRRLLREERRRRREAESLARMREDFVHVLAHELRTPLTVIGGALQLLAQAGRDPQESEMIASARRRAKDLERMIEGLELVGETIAPGPPTPLAAAMAEAASGLSQVPDVIDVADEEWPGVPRRYLTRIAYELMDNALRHGASPVEVRARREGDTGVLTVLDSGPQAPDLEMFSAFVQGDMSSTRERAGMGLGLYVCGRLCDALDGSVGIRREGGCTVAEVRLPLGS